MASQKVTLLDVNHYDHDTPCHSLFLISFTSKFSSAWATLYTFMCLVSSYTYIFVIVFSADEILINNLIISLNLEAVIEGFFCINILKNFITSFPDQ